MKKRTSAKGRNRGERRPCFQAGDKISWICLRYPAALPGTPGRNDLAAYRDRLNSVTTFITGQQLPHHLRAMFAATRAEYLHTQNPIFQATSILQYIVFGFFPPSPAWLGWFLPVLRHFRQTMSAKPSSIDQALKLSNSGDMFRRAGQYRLMQKFMFEIHMDIGVGVPAKEAAGRVLRLYGPIQGTGTAEGLRQRYYKEDWPFFFSQVLQHFHGGSQADLQALHCEPPDSEMVAAYPPEDLLNNGWQSSDFLSSLSELAPYKSIHDIPGYEETLLSLNRRINDHDPLGVLDILLWFDNRGCYPPGNVLFWIANAFDEFLRSAGKRRLSECLGFRPGVDPWRHTKADMFKSCLALQALVVNQAYGIPISGIAQKQYERSQNISEFFPIRDPEKLRQNAYAYRGKLEQSGVLDRASKHPEEYFKPLQGGNFDK